MKHFPRSVRSLAFALAFVLVAGAASASVTAEEAARLGHDLTPVGAERAGNPEGTVPPYTGGLTSGPSADAVRKGVRADPFAAEKPLFSIDAGNLDRHADKLSAGTQALLRGQPGFRLDVYPAHRTVAFPKTVLDHTAENATRAALTAGGLGMTGARGGIPFPIPANGLEVMQNTHARHAGVAQLMPDNSIYYTDKAGDVVLSNRSSLLIEFPYYDDRRSASSPLILRARKEQLFPASAVGQVLLQWEPLSYADHERRYWQYLPGQRRVRVVPDVGHDQINGVTGGIGTVDDVYLFSGKLDRFRFALVGKRELYVPYNTYRFAYHEQPEQVFLPKFVNPDLVRWELHRVWVVEATLKAGARHLYSRRTFYVDEDSWSILASDQYDQDGKLSRAGFSYLHQAWDATAPIVHTFGHYDLLHGVYYVAFWPGKAGVTFPAALQPDASWSPEGLAARGVR